MRVEQNGPETCAVAANGTFVLVHVPVRATGERVNAKVLSRYRIGGFQGRETAWPAGGQSDAVLWSKRYELRWAKDSRCWSRSRN